MARIQAPKLLGLIGLGFVVVALPLLVAIVTAIEQVDRLAAQSREALMSVQQNASISRTLADRVREVERTARQYQALGDPEYRALYAQHREAVLEMLDRLATLNRNDDLRSLLADARLVESRANDRFEASVAGAGGQDLEAAFVDLREASLAIVRQLNAEADDLSRALPEDAARLQDLLLAQAVLVIPLSVGLALLFSVLVSRAFGQVDRGIRMLGRGELSAPIRVRGTKDLEALGTRLEWLRIRLQELETQKAEFLRNVSHELKTPLTNVRESAELLADERGCESAEERRAIIGILRDNSVRLQKMIEALLRYGAISASSPAVSEAVRFDELVEESVEKLRSAPATRAVRLDTSLLPAVVEANPTRLRVVIDNLVSNAVRYSPVDGAVQVVMGRDSGMVWLDVSDDGPGIASSEVPHVFEWFYTGRQPVDALIAGTGMGLAVAREYTEQQGGRVELLPSVQGARFRVTLTEKSE